MKIEMGESLLLSWLRHVKQCQIVQLNWKPSNSWQISNQGQIEQLMSRARDVFMKQHKRELFGKKPGQSYTQILRQGEIDVLGIKLSGNKISSIYAVDVAFHEHGLHYGKSPQDAINRVIKKMIRSTMIVMAYFGTKRGDVIFASPKINPSTFEPLRQAVQHTNEFVQDMKLAFSYKLYANHEFEEHVISPVVLASGEVADTSELFMRSIQMYQMFDKNHRLKKNTREVHQDDIKTSIPGTDETKKIGEFVRNTFIELFEKRKISSVMVRNLSDREYSKTIFGLGFPVLKKICADMSLNEQCRDSKGDRRYWNKAFGDGKYLICSQWYKGHRKRFVDWLDELNKS